MMLASLLLAVALAEEPPPPADDAPMTQEEIDAVLQDMGDQFAAADDPRVVEMLAWSPTKDAETELTMRFLVHKERSLPFQSGTVTVGEGAIRLDLGEELAYLGPDETAVVLEDWGNPPGIETLGMIKPSDGWLYGPDSWAVILEYEQEGWIDDADAASIDYDELLVSMQADNAMGNQEREQLGLSTMTLTGWAEPPSYDGTTHRLYWAKAFSDSDGDSTLNYDVRTLGRYGTLSMNAVAGLDMLDMVKGEMVTIRDIAHFHDGHRYADYQPGVDRAAGYGLAALVAGGAGAAAMKGGFFKGLMAMLLAGKKFIVVGFVALAGMLKAVFSRSKREE